MIPFINKPVLAHILKLLKRHRFTEVIITVQYLADQIQAYFGNGSDLGITIHYAVEERPLGTAGSIKNAQPFLDDETFLVISGDIITDIDLAKALRFHRQKQATATLVLKQVADLQGYGVVATDCGGRITQYQEKPDGKQIISNTINTGIYFLEPDVLATMKPNQPYDFSYNIFPLLLRRKALLFGYVAADYWSDIGTIASYLETTADVLAGKVKHIDLGHHIGGNVWIGKDVEIAPDATLRGPIYLGDKVKIKSGATIYGPTVVQDQAVIASSALIEQSVVGQNWLLSEAAGVG